MTTQEKIDKLLTERYNNFRGDLWGGLKALHEFILKTKGDEAYLKFIEEQEALNPRPKYHHPFQKQQYGNV